MSLEFYYHKNLPKYNELKQEYLRKQVIKLKNTFQPVQKSKEWYEMRNGLLTASDWGKILDGKNDVLLKKCGDDTFIGGDAIDWGNKYEPVANMIYEHRNNVEVLEFGCLKHPFIDYLGASPDGITPDGIMVEIKCPYTRKITGIPKPEYWCQVQGQLEVCDLDRCDFIECCLKEYEGEIDYIDDNYHNNYRLNSYGNEKGAIAEFYRKSDKTFFNKYSYIGIIGESLEEWKKQIVKENTNNDIMFYRFCYWKLIEVSCIPIYRNHEWFHKSKPILEKFWKKVLKYRELGLSKLREDISNGKVSYEDDNLMVNNTNLVSSEIKIVEKKTKLTKTIKPKIDQTNKKQKNMKDFIVLEESIILNDYRIETSSSSDDDNDNIEIKEDLSFDVSISFFSDN